MCVCVYIASSRGLIILMKSWQAFDLIINKQKKEEESWPQRCQWSQKQIPHTVKHTQTTPYHIRGATLYIPAANKQTHDRLVRSTEILVVFLKLLLFYGRGGTPVRLLWYHTSAIFFMRFTHIPARTRAAQPWTTWPYWTVSTCADGSAGEGHYVLNES